MLQNKNQQLDCPICDSEIILLGSVDFNKSCGGDLPNSGKLIDYHVCNICQFVFSQEIYGWPKEQFINEVYNEQYVKVDEDYLQKRLEGNASLIHKTFPNKEGIRHLDYGGGNGVLSECLRLQDWNSQSYDPFNSEDEPIESLGTFDLITVFEVFEHVPNVNELFKNLSRLTDNQSMVIFSTLLSDGQLNAATKIDWWYASPRNGHISLFSKKSLQLLASQHSWNLHSFSQNLHVLYKIPSKWNQHLFN